MALADPVVRLHLLAPWQREVLAGSEEVAQRLSIALVLRAAGDPRASAVTFRLKNSPAAAVRAEPAAALHHRLEREAPDDRPDGILADARGPRSRCDRTAQPAWLWAEDDEALPGNGVKSFRHLKSFARATNSALAPPASATMIANAIHSRRMRDEVGPPSRERKPRSARGDRRRRDRAAANVVRRRSCSVTTATVRRLRVSCRGGASSSRPSPAPPPSRSAARRGRRRLDARFLTRATRRHGSPSWVRDSRG